MGVADQGYLKCPKCSASLPDWSQVCQFCGADLKNVARPVRVTEKKRYKEFETPKWIWTCYYAIAGWWVISGLMDIGNAFYIFGKPLELLKLEKEFNMTAGPSIVGAVIGALTLLFGIGLILRLEIIRGIVNVFAGLQLLFGLLGLAGSLLGSVLAGPMAIPFILMNIADIISAGMLIWLIGETDMRANI